MDGKVRRGLGASVALFCLADLTIGRWSAAAIGWLIAYAVAVSFLIGLFFLVRRTMGSSIQRFIGEAVYLLLALAAVILAPIMKVVRAATAAVKRFLATSPTVNALIFPFVLLHIIFQAEKDQAEGKP